MRYSDLSDDWDRRYEQLENIVKELREYAELEGTEFGEMTYALVNLWGCQLTEEFEESVEKEMCNVLEHYEANYKIVEKTETYIETYKTLEEIV